LARSEEKQKSFKPCTPKLWYGWFGKGTQDGWQIASQFKRFVKNIKKLKEIYIILNYSL
jgi:hypothetical protein